MNIEYDFDNPEKYLIKDPSTKSLETAMKLDAALCGVQLNEYDSKFIDNVRERILMDRKLTEKQRGYLSVILTACKEGTYDPKKLKKRAPRRIAGYNV